MLLLHTRTFQLRGFEGRDIPKYAILSHTWGDDEILFQDLSEPQSPTWRQKQAFGKVAGSCRKASDHGYDWIWIDTCCIDKSSSAELSEAINSMFRYYKDSAECYVYMADLEPGRKLHSGNRWFTRGWTLQELIAPSDVRFYNSSWGYIGNKLCLSEDLAFITVPIQDVLASTSTARIMSWASKRETKKEEDIAYSLIGLFDVNIPLLYGEGSKAFIRLQHEIVRKRKDQSILAWRNPLVQLPPYRDFWNNSREISPLAPSPGMETAAPSTTSTGATVRSPIMSCFVRILRRRWR
ncbi:heterokaryon incompatibility protein-domain-containing protein [Truncatella angustata]|uniref:Heterokaryon incompatibility protein-domain-containing protein n=1 Tax=Truncatella angustata TaxID=152316 RepID=A0A9P8UAG1_9PEZI|nr:heterokaryon incompatibility protein-domain-containing protein [Truncatella angustata]KAH6647254.1 heterokaryon incompatibility protein-domain-containing protein [Truncatella angustata]